jgi:hypothetical protein
VERTVDIFESYMRSWLIKAIDAIKSQLSSNEEP